MRTFDYKAAACELLATTTAYRTMMGRWLVDASKWKAENLTRYTWTIPPGTYILPQGEPLYIGHGAHVNGSNSVTLVCEVMNQFAPWPLISINPYQDGFKMIGS